MSYRSSYGSSGDSRRHSSSSRRDSPPRHRSSGSRRSPSPGPSRRPKEEPPQPRDPKKLPESFGRGEESRIPEDDSNILQRMKSHYQASPLSDLYECIKSEKKIKIWTRNFKEVRGVMTGYLVAFDKHWNLALRDVDEVFLKPKKSKTPFLREIAANESLPDIPAKVPRQKKEGTTPEPEPPKKPAAEGEVKKKRSRRKKAKSTSAKRQICQLFVRGDNIVMVCPFDEPPAEEEEEEEEMEGEEGGDDNRNV